MTTRHKSKFDARYFSDLGYGFAAICAGVTVVVTFVWVLS